MSSGNSSTPPHRLPRLRHLMMAVFAGLILVPVAALALMPLLAGVRYEREQAIRQIEVLADAGSASLDRWAGETAAILDRLATGDVSRPLLLELATGSDTGQGAALYRAAQAQFARQAETAHPFDRVMLLDASGTVRASSDPNLVGHDFSAEAWFEAALAPTAMGSVVVTGPLRDVSDAQESLFFARPLHDDRNVLVGVLAGRVSTTLLHNILMSIPVWGKTSDFYLIRTGQQYVVPPRLGEGAGSDGIALVALAGENGSGAWRDYRGQLVIGAYRWIPTLNMALVLKQDMGEVQKANEGLLRLQLIVGGLAALAALGVALVVTGRAARVVDTVSAFSSRIAAGELALRVPGSSVAELNEVARSVNRIAERLDALAASQDAIIQERTRALEITARMGHAIASETDTDRLLQTTIEMIRDRLGYYHAQVFLLDDLRQHAVLRASMGEAGRQMMARGHKLAVGSRSVVGQAVARGEPVLASNTRHAEYWLPNPLLPETRAELAIPLRLGDQIIGALDVQATEPDAFDEATISVLQTIADQLGVAIRNAQLFEEKENLLSASLELTRMLTQDSWESYLARRRERQVMGFEYDLHEVRPLDETGRGNGGNFRLPIALRGAVIGELTAELGADRVLTDEDRELVGQVLDRVALAIDNARLVEQTQLSLMQTNRLYQASQGIAAATTLDQLSETLVQLAAIETVDRVFLLLLESPGQQPGQRWVRVSRAWLRDPDDPLSTLPDRLQTGEHPLLHGLEGALSGAWVINDLSDAALDAAARASLEQLGIQSLAAFPIVPPLSGQNALGWLVMHGLQPGAFEEEDVRFFETVADQAATALEGLRLFEQTQSRARRLQATNEVTRVASSILDPDILLPLIVEHISQAFGYYHVQVFLIDDLREWAVLRASTGDVGRELLRRGHRLAVGSRSVIGQVMETGEPVIVRDTDLDPVHRRNELLPNTRAEMAIPLRMGERVIGALDVQSTQSDAFDAEAQAILQSLADQIAVTLENAQLFREIQDRVAELTTVNLISQTVSRAQTLDELYDVVTDQLMRQFGARYGFLGVLDDRRMLHLPIFIEDGRRMESPAPQPVAQGLSGHVIRTRQVLVINEHAEQLARELGARVIGAMPKSVLIAPLMIGDEVIGVISIQDAEREHAYSEAHVRQLTTLAAYIAVKIRNAELLDEAQRRADELGFLFAVTRAAVSSADLTEALRSVSDLLLREVRGAESVVFYLASPGSGRFEAQAAVGYGRDLAARQVSLAPDEGLVGVAVAAGEAVLLSDARQSLYNLDDAQTRAAIALPLASGQDVLGVLAVESSQPDVFTESHVRLLEGASSTLVAVIQNARLLEQITQANEQLRELDKLKSQFLANMSHELRTPLNSIIGFSRVMLKGIDGPLNDLQSQDLTTIYNSGQHLLGLINNILDLSKIEAGKMEIQPEYMSLNEIIEGVIATGRGLVKDKPIQILKQVDEDLPQVYGDPVRVRQVLLNLMSNAAKFTQEGSITVQVTRKAYNAKTGEPPRVQIDVIDTGIGIAPEDMGRLFEAFSQVDGSTTRQVGGTGLGLTISKEFIEMMGGRIWVESEVGVGSTFSFTVPLHPPGAEMPEVIVATGANGERPLVLAVDDEPGVLELYARYLEKGGYAVVGLNNANDIVKQVRDYQPAAILLDLNLPGKSGWEAVADLKQADDTRSIPVLVCTIEEDLPPAGEAGIAGYLTKPIIQEDLLGALNWALSAPTAGVRRILILDGDEEFAHALGMVLEQEYGCQTRLCSTGLAGLEAVQEGVPDAMILDLDLPDMDGYGLLMALRTQSDLRSLPVVILTARNLTGLQLEPVDAGATCWVAKPPIPDKRLGDELLAALSSLR